MVDQQVRPDPEVIGKLGRTAVRSGQRLDDGKPMRIPERSMHRGTRSQPPILLSTT
jgi:hypothetical protein